jgi:tetratricopeptide (TPR) repeat protein
VVALALVFLVAAPAKGQEETKAEDAAREQMVEGEALHRKGDLEAALEQFDQALRHLPQDTNAYCWRAATLMALERYEEAIKDFDRAIALDPRLALAYVNRAIALGYLGRYRPAIADCDRAIELDAKYAKAVATRGVLRVKAGRKEWKKALEDFDRSIELAPRASLTYYNRGDLKRKMGDLVGARVDFERTLQLNPLDGECYMGLGSIDVLQGHPDRAKENLLKALEIL